MRAHVCAGRGAWPRGRERGGQSARPHCPSKRSPTAERRRSGLGGLEEGLGSLESFIPSAARAPPPAHRHPSAQPRSALPAGTDSPARTKCFLLRPARYSRKGILYTPDDMTSLFSLPGTQPGNSSSTCALQGRHVLHPVCCRCSAPSLPAGVRYCPPNLSLGSPEA